MGKLILKKITSNQDVYDITVDDTHKFIANNVVVHNCGK